jgi:hypothetical protein
VIALLSVRQRRRNAVLGMPHAALASILGREFDNFLYASIDEDKSGKLLSVLSALARLDVDPWREAAKLARLPEKAATERLTELIAALPDEASAHRSAGTIAIRLVALLPRGVGPMAVAPRQPSPDAGLMTNPRWAGYAILLALTLFAVCDLLSSRSSTPVDNPHPPPSAAGGVSPPTFQR